MQNQEEDLKKINKLHQTDQTAAKNQDYKTLRSILSDDAVIMPPKAGFIKGKKNLDTNFEKMTASYSGVEILDYQFNFHQVIICGEYAFEYGTITGKSKVKSSEEVTSASYKMMRVLRKEGSAWKVFRTIWNDLK